MLSFRLFFAVALFACTGIATAAGQDVGTVVALRGTAAIERGGRRLAAAVDSGIRLKDIITTSAGSRVKIRFIDESVLTLVDNSRLAIKDFLYNKETGGNSVFSLLDGKMHSIVGKTKFQVETPTAIAAARGTVIFFQVSSSRQ